MWEEEQAQRRNEMEEERRMYAGAPIRPATILNEGGQSVESFTTRRPPFLHSPVFNERGILSSPLRTPKTIFEPISEQSSIYNPHSPTGLGDALRRGMDGTPLSRQYLPELPASGSGQAAFVPRPGGVTPDNAEAFVPSEADTYDPRGGNGGGIPMTASRPRNGDNPSPIPGTHPSDLYPRNSSSPDPQLSSPPQRISPPITSSSRGLPSDRETPASAEQQENEDWHHRRIVIRPLVRISWLLSSEKLIS